MEERKMDAELDHKGMEARKCVGVLKNIRKNRNVSMQIKRASMKE